MISAIRPASAGVVAIIFAEYIIRFLSLFLSLRMNESTAFWAQKLVALLGVWTVVGINVVGTRWGIFNIMLTLVKLTAVGLIAGTGVIALGIFQPETS